MISLGNNAVGIGLVIRLRDQFSANANRISNQFNQMYGNANRALKQNLVAARQVGFGMALIGGMGVRGFAKATAAAADFNYVLSGVRAATNASATQMRQLHDQALLVGTQSKFTANEVASAMEYLAKAGFEVPDIQKSIRGVADLGAAADTAIGGKEGAAGIMANILNTFGMKASQATMVADVMSRTAVKSSVDMLDLAESIKYSGSVATTLKIPFQDLNAMLGVLGNAGMRGSMAGVGLSNMLMYLSKAVGPFRTQRQADALQLLGIDPKQLLDAKGNLIPMIDLVDLFTRKMRNLSATQQVSTLEGLMNIRGARAFVPLMRKTEMGMTLPEMLEDLNKKAAGASKTMADMRMDTLKGDLMILADTWHAFKIEVGETLEPLVRIGAKLITKILNGVIAFARHPLGKPIIIMAAALSVAVAVGGALIVALTTIRLMTMVNSVSFANMGRSLVWAWNSGTAAALRYGTVAKGVNMVSTPFGPRFRGAGGRFVRGGGAAVASTGFFGGIRAGFGRVMQAIGGFSGALTWVGRLLKGVGGAVVGFISIIGYVAGFKNILKLLGYALGSFLQSIMFIVDFVANIGEGPIDAFGIAKERFQKRNALLRQSMLGTMGKSDLQEATESSMKAMQNKPTIGGEQQRKDMEAAALKYKEKQKAAIYLDSVKVGEAFADNDLYRALQGAKVIKD